MRRYLNELRKLVCACRPPSAQHKAFRGLRVVLLGDMHQLPAVKRKEFGLVFRSDAWRALEDDGLVLAELRQLFRQVDPQFISLLRDVRDGTLSAASHEFVRTMSTPHRQVTAEHVQLLAQNDDTDKMNADRLAELPGDMRELRAADTSGGSKSWVDSMRASARVPRVLKLKVGARVMHTVNTTKLVNGSTGTVTAFDDDGHPVVAFDCGIEKSIEPWEFTENARADGRDCWFTRRQVPPASCSP